MQVARQLAALLVGQLSSEAAMALRVTQLPSLRLFDAQQQRHMATHGISGGPSGSIAIKRFYKLVSVSEELPGQVRAAAAAAASTPPRRPAAPSTPCAPARNPHITPPAQGGYQILLDSRALRTPATLPFVLPTRAAAMAVAAEWECQVRPRAAPGAGACTRAARRRAKHTPRGPPGLLIAAPSPPAPPAG